MESKYSRSSTALISSSSGVATVSDTTSGLAPAYFADTVIIVGTISGYSATGIVRKQRYPQNAMKMDTTKARRGCSMNTRENICFYFPLNGSTLTPFDTLWTPSATIFSPGLTPLVIVCIPCTIGPRLT